MYINNEGSASLQAQAREAWEAVDRRNKARVRSLANTSGDGQQEPKGQEVKPLDVELNFYGKEEGTSEEGKGKTTVEKEAKPKETSKEETPQAATF